MKKLIYTGIYVITEPDKMKIPLRGSENRDDGRIRMKGMLFCDFAAFLCPVVTASCLFLIHKN